MKNPTSPTLPKIDGPELMNLARAGLIADADGLRREVSKALAALDPVAIVALAMSITPDKSAAVALQQFRDKTTELLGLLSVSSQEAQGAQRAEQHRLAGVVSAAAHRSLEIVGDVEFIDRTIRSGQLRNESKREELRKAGLTGDKLDAAAAPCDFSELQAQSAALLAECEQLQNFLKTRDTAHLPPGFACEVRDAAKSFYGRAQISQVQHRGSRK